jgi:hypothetical protein
VFEAPYQQEEEQGSRKDDRALFKPDPSTITDDDRLEVVDAQAGVDDSDHNQDDSDDGEEGHRWSSG